MNQEHRWDLPTWPVVGVEHWHPIVPGGRADGTMRVVLYAPLYALREHTPWYITPTSST